VIALDDTGVLRVVIAEDNYLVREGLRRLLEDSGEIDVIASVGNGVELLDAVRRLGPDAVLTDIRMPPGHLVHALREVRAGGSVIDPQIVDTLVRRRSAAGAASPLAALSPRELEVLREMAAGKTNAGIEQALFLSSSTVEKHVNAIFTKLRLPESGVHRRVAAVLAFLQSSSA